MSSTPRPQSLNGYRPVAGLTATALTAFEIQLVQLLAEQFQLDIGELTSDLVRRGLRESLKAQGLRALRMVPGGVS